MTINMWYYFNLFLLSNRHNKLSKYVEDFFNHVSDFSFVVETLSFLIALFCSLFEHSQFINQNCLKFFDAFAVNWIIGKFEVSFEVLSFFQVLLLNQLDISFTSSPIILNLINVKRPNLFSFKEVVNDIVSLFH